MEKIIKYFNKHRYLRMKELKKAFFQTRDIAKLLKQGIIHKIKPGLYRLDTYYDCDDISTSFIDICQAVSKGVICLISALDFHGLTTFNPADIYVAVPQGEKIPKIIYPPVKGYYFSKQIYSAGIEIYNTSYGVVKIYNKEKTICDMFRYRNKLGEDLALEGLKNYMHIRGCSINNLMEYAKICHVSSTIYPYLKAIVT